MAFHTHHAHDDAGFLPPTTQNSGFTGNTYIDGILWGGNHYDNVITYSFWSDASLDDAYEAIDTSDTTWAVNEILALQEALETWSNVANIDFVRVADNSTNAELSFSLVNTPESNFAGYFAPPGTFGAGIGYFNYQNLGWNTADLQQGGFGFVTLIHELGHGLGLAHPHDNGGGSSLYPGVFGAESLGLHALNQGIWTTMSYNDGWESANGELQQPQNGLPSITSYGYQGTPMAFDIAAIQHLYGANLNYRTGDDVYTLPTTNGSGTFYAAIWDAGGNDTVMSDATFADITINLNQASLVGPNAGGYVSSVGGVYGGFTIAHDVVIENAFGSLGNDTLTGNEADNFLSGRSGNDTLVGGAGDDTLSGGFGGDVLRGGTGRDTLYGRAGIDFLYGEAGNDLIEGGDGDDLLSGQAGDDILYGEAGNDMLGGGIGVDILFGGEGNDALYGRDGIDFLYGEAGDDIVHGGEGDDVLSGQTGDDILNGQSGNDVLGGGIGNDVLYGEAGNDTLYGRHDHDIVFGQTGDDTLEGGDGNDILNGGNGTDILDGNAGRDTLIGVNALGTAGLFEYDVLTGGTGADIFVLGDANGVYYDDWGYATITDFSWLEGDRLQVSGNRFNYELDYSQNFSGAATLDTSIYYQNDLIGVVEDTTSVLLALDFNYV